MQLFFRFMCFASCHLRSLPCMLTGWRRIIVNPQYALKKKKKRKIKFFVEKKIDKTWLRTLQKFLWSFLRTNSFFFLKHLTSNTCKIQNQKSKKCCILFTLCLYCSTASVSAFVCTLGWYLGVLWKTEKAVLCVLTLITVCDVSPTLSCGCWERQSQVKPPGQEALSTVLYCLVLLWKTRPPST